MARLDAIRIHYQQSLPGDEPKAAAEAVGRVVDLIIDRMLDQDMPEQEIISILLPIDHPLNSTPGGGD